MIILISPKGWGLPPELDHKPLENSFLSHQVPISKSDQHTPILEAWLRSYNPQTWFQQPNHGDQQGAISKLRHTSLKLADNVSRILPKNELLRMGRTCEAHGGGEDIKLPDWKSQAVNVKPTAFAPIMDTLGRFLADVAKLNKDSFRVMSPDELQSNHLSALLEDKDLGGRNFQHAENDRNSGGRVIEILSEHVCQGFAQGYSITGRCAVFPSYEAFLPIVDTMVVQYAKFIKQAKETPFRKPFRSITLIESSTVYQQMHNGFSHVSARAKLNGMPKLTLLPAFSKMSECSARCSIYPTMSLASISLQTPIAHFLPYTTACAAATMSISLSHLKRLLPFLGSPPKKQTNTASQAAAFGRSTLHLAARPPMSSLQESAFRRLQKLSLLAGFCRGTSQVSAFALSTLRTSLSFRLPMIPTHTRMLSNKRPSMPCSQRKFQSFSTRTATSAK